MNNDNIFVAFRPAPTIRGDYYSSNGRQVHSLLKRSDCGLYPELYAEGLCKPDATGFNKALGEYHDLSRGKIPKSIGLPSTVIKSYYDYDDARKSSELFANELNRSLKILHEKQNKHQDISDKIKDLYRY